MARGVNKVILVGNLGNDPDVRATQAGSTVTSLSVATSDQWRDKNTGEMQERTEWHRVVMFNKLGEIAAQYLRKGSKVYIEGRLQTRKWQDQATGQDRYTTEIVANEMQMLDGRGDMNEGGYNQRPQQGGNNYAPPQGGGGNYGAPQQGGAYQQPQHSGGASRSAPVQQDSGPSNYDDFDDDIPF